MLTKYTEPYPGYQRFFPVRREFLVLTEATKPETALEKSLAPWVTEPENQDEIKV